jgi:hypothetical protein
MLRVEGAEEVEPVCGAEHAAAVRQGQDLDPARRFDLVAAGGCTNRSAMLGMDDPQSEAGELAGLRQSPEVRRVLVPRLRRGHVLQGA